jgi:RHS repeat-associated protein
VYFNNLTIVRTVGNQRAAHDYYPYGLTWSNIDSGELHNKAFQGKDFQQNEWGEHGLEVYDFHARMYDPVLGRWSVVDPLAEKYSNMAPYTFSANNPILFIDPSGMDIVYYDANGNETKRDSNNEVFETYVDLKGDGTYMSAPMPNIIDGYEDPVYQKYDYMIAAQTFIFNNSDKSELKTENGLQLDGDAPTELSPTLVKALTNTGNQSWRDRRLLQSQWIQ